MFVSTFRSIIFNSVALINPLDIIQKQGRGKQNSNEGRGGGGWGAVAEKQAPELGASIYLGLGAGSHRKVSNLDARKC